MYPRTSWCPSLHLICEEFLCMGYYMAGRTPMDFLTTYFVTIDRYVFQTPSTFHARLQRTSSMLNILITRANLFKQLLIKEGILTYTTYHCWILVSLRLDDDGPDLSLYVSPMLNNNFDAAVVLRLQLNSPTIQFYKVTLQSCEGAEVLTDSCTNISHTISQRFHSKIFAAMVIPESAEYTFWMRVIEQSMLTFWLHIVEWTCSCTTAFLTPKVYCGVVLTLYV